VTSRLARGQEFAHIPEMLEKRFAAMLLLAIAVGSTACRQGTLPGASPALEASVTTPAPSTPEVFSPGIISDANEQWRITFTPDGRTAYFAESVDFFPFTRKATIYVSRLVNGNWSEPVTAPFSGQYSDIDPFISPDGRRLYFSSIRPVNGVARNDIDIWMVERTTTGWSEPIHLGPEVNTDSDELYPSASSNGTLYFASGPMAPQPGRHWDIYSAKRDGNSFAPRIALEGVNTTPTASDPNLQSAWEFNPEISADGRMLIFTSLRPGGFGLGDLYVSRFNNGKWGASSNLGPVINTTSDEYHPTLSRGGRDLYFVRRGPQKGNFYRVSVEAIPALHLHIGPG
jgi:Tol biopolymer transport system component